VEGLLTGMGRVPGLRALMKSAIKGGLDLADAVKGLAAGASRRWERRGAGAAPAVAPGGAASGAGAAPAGAAGPSRLIEVDGIGPGVSGVLARAGVTTLEQLAALDEARLRALLTAAGRPYQSMDPTTWPEQARGLLAPAETTKEPH